MEIGDYIIDSDGHCCKIVDIVKTNISMSVRVYHLRKTEKGINCTQWYAVDKLFHQRFKLGLKGYLEWLNKASYEQIKLYFNTKSKIDE